MKVFISQAMRGLTDEEILKTREEAIKFAKHNDWFSFRRYSRNY